MKISPESATRFILELESGIFIRIHTDPREEVITFEFMDQQHLPLPQDLVVWDSKLKFIELYDAIKVETKRRW